MRSIGEGHEERFEGQSAEPGPAGADCQVRIGRFGVPVFTAPIEATAALDGLADLADVDVRALDDDTCLGLFDALEVADRLFHSTRFVLVDARGVVRGFYGTADDGDVPKLIADIQQLASEPAP